MIPGKRFVEAVVMLAPARKNLISSNLSLELAGPATSTKYLQPSLKRQVVLVFARH
jgi:hypothetical protein